MFVRLAEIAAFVAYNNLLLIRRVSDDTKLMTSSPLEPYFTQSVVLYFKMNRKRGLDIYFGCVIARNLIVLAVGLLSHMRVNAEF